jgi:acyl-coenzyme A thioesterase PaaI-like protein
MSGLIFDLRQRFLEKAINFYGPFLGAGVKLKELSKDYRYAKVTMPLTFYNKNYMGTQFGGSLYAMVDPWYMLMLIKNLGKNYIVWDKGATIRFKKPGKGKVTAEFVLTQEIIDEIKTHVEDKTKMDYTFKVEIKDEAGTLICEVDKVVYIRKKA